MLKEQKPRSVPTQTDISRTWAPRECLVYFLVSSQLDGLIYSTIFFMHEVLQSIFKLKAKFDSLIIELWIRFDSSFTCKHWSCIQLRPWTQWNFKTAALAALDHHVNHCPIAVHCMYVCFSEWYIWTDGLQIFKIPYV